MPFNLDTYDETGRDLNEHDLKINKSDHTTHITIVTDDFITQAIIEDRLTRFVHNLGTGVQINVDITEATHKHLDNHDF